MSGSVSLINGHIDPDTSRMTDKEIIKVLENLLFNRKCKIAKSGEQFITLGDILDLINRQQAEHDKLKNNYRETLTKQVDLCDVVEKQQAEIERLTINMNAFGLGMKREKERADTIRAETIKEFAGKIADVFCSHDKGDTYVREIVYNLVKEMVGE